MPSSVVFYEKRKFPVYFALAPLLLSVNLYLSLFAVVLLFLLSNWFLPLRVFFCFKKAKFHSCSHVLYNKSLFGMNRLSNISFLEIDKVVWIIKPFVGTKARILEPEVTSNGHVNAPDSREIHNPMNITDSQQMNQSENKTDFQEIKDTESREIKDTDSRVIKDTESREINDSMNFTDSRESCGEIHFIADSTPYVMYPLVPDLSQPLRDYMLMEAFFSPEFKLLNLRNELKAPKASFFQILYKNLLAPFFVFQLFSNLLWCYDEYFYHGLFSISMQFMFEIGVSFARVQALKMFGKSDIHPVEVVLISKESFVGNTSVKRGSFPANIQSEQSNDKLQVASEKRGSFPANTQSERSNDKLQVSSEKRGSFPADIHSKDGSRIHNESQDTSSECSVSVKNLNSKNSSQGKNEFQDTSKESRMFVKNVNSEQGKVVPPLKSINSVDLFPGDLVAIHTPGIHVPCDLLILHGACSVNEAMLTGESIPLHKEDIFESSAGQNLCLNKHKRHVLFGGTELIKINEMCESESNSNTQVQRNTNQSQENTPTGSQVNNLSQSTPTESQGNNISQSTPTGSQGNNMSQSTRTGSDRDSLSVTNESISFGENNSFKDTICAEYSKKLLLITKLLPKDKPHIICCVLNTGYNTQQGKLIQKMIQTEEVSVESTEAYLFIGCLLVFALIGCFILTFDYYTNKRFLYKPQKKLVVELIFLLTNVVPSELPIELSLAINSALQCLMRVGVFCLEPFRIPLAGKVDVCCFDKTGTLTETDLTVKCIVTQNELSKLSIFENETIQNAKNETKQNNKDLSSENQTIQNAKNETIRNNKNETIRNNKDLSTLRNNLIATKYCEKKDRLTLDEKLLLVASTCHSLVKTQQILGDPMEKSILAHFKIQLQNDLTANYNQMQATITKRWAFTSELKRMTTIGKYTVSEDHPNNNSQSMFKKRTKKPHFFVAMKGAPEIILNFLANKPKNYDHYLQYAKQGYRVIALAYKQTNNRILLREEAEANLEFLGFVVYECRIKERCVETIKELLDSKIKVVMITGDNLLTAVAVSRKIGIIKQNNTDILLLHGNTYKQNHDTLDDACKQNHDTLCNPLGNTLKQNQDSFGNDFPSNDCISFDNSNRTGEGSSPVGDKNIQINNDEINASHSDHSRGDSSSGHDLAVEGEQIDYVLKNDDLFEKTKIFARASPEQKEKIIKKYKQKNTVLMCGDGTNDVGALKSAHIGVALVEPKKPPKKTKKPEKPHKKMTLKEKLQENMDKINENNDEKKVQLGDASAAAPFTSKTTIDSITTIIKQGRSTLATTTQMHKILALNCIITAFSLSILDLKGIKYGETQMVVSGILIAFAFMFITKSKPHCKISEKKPINTVFCKYVIFSIMLQTIIHILCFVFLLSFIKTNNIYDISGFGMKSSLATNNENIEITQIPETQLIKEQQYMEKKDLQNDEFNKRYDEHIKFRPSTLNSAIFLLSTTQQITTFIINYIGKPFRESLFENTHLRNSLMCVSGICFALILEIWPEFSRFMEIVPLGSTRLIVGTAVFFDFLLCFLAEKMCFLKFIK